MLENKKVFITNRGEIACRIQNTLTRLGAIGVAAARQRGLRHQQPGKERRSRGHLEGSQGTVSEPGVSGSGLVHLESGGEIEGALAPVGLAAPGNVLSSELS